MHTLHSEAGGRSDRPDVVGSGAGVGPAVLYDHGCNVKGHLACLTAGTHRKGEPKRKKAKNSIMEATEFAVE